MRPRLTASSTSKAPTTVPAAEISHLRRPADISSIILPSSTADTCNRFVAGHALWTFQTKRCCAPAEPGPCHRTAASTRTGRAKAIQAIITGRVAFMAPPWRLGAGRRWTWYSPGASGREEIVPLPLDAENGARSPTDHLLCHAPQEEMRNAGVAGGADDDQIGGELPAEAHDLVGRDALDQPRLHVDACLRPRF